MDDAERFPQHVLTDVVDLLGKYEGAVYVGLGHYFVYDCIQLSRADRPALCRHLVHLR
jgi:hypothetical protein